MKGVIGNSPLESAGCGSLAGAVAAAATTPLDVAKTRIMLKGQGKLVPTLRAVYAEAGIKRYLYTINSNVVNFNNPYCVRPYVMHA